MSEKKKIMVISDHPMAPSGVGTQTKYFIEALINTGKYKFICLGGAIKHHDYAPQKIEGYGDDWIVQPVNGYGDQQIIRSALTMEKPDLIWFMTDPRLARSPQKWKITIFLMQLILTYLRNWKNKISKILLKSILKKNMIQIELYSFGTIEMHAVK